MFLSLPIFSPPFLTYLLKAYLKYIFLKEVFIFELINIKLLCGREKAHKF